MKLNYIKLVTLCCLDFAQRFFPIAKLLFSNLIVKVIVHGDILYMVRVSRHGNTQ